VLLLPLSAKPPPAVKVTEPIVKELVPPGFPAV
jgi:hypothetical protein